MRSLPATVHSRASELKETFRNLNQSLWAGDGGQYITRKVAFLYRAAKVSKQFPRSMCCPMALALQPLVTANRMRLIL